MGCEDTELQLLLQVATGQSGARFRAGQREVIEALRSRRRLLVAGATGWGKDLVCLLATHLGCRDGGSPTLQVSSAVPSPVEATRIGVIAADWNTAHAEERARIRLAFTAGGVDLLVISPEHLVADDFLMPCLLPMATRLGLLVVDHADLVVRDDEPHRRLQHAVRVIPTATPLLATTTSTDPALLADLRTRLAADQLIIPAD